MKLEQFFVMDQPGDHFELVVKFVNESPISVKIAHDATGGDIARVLEAFAQALSFMESDEWQDARRDWLQSRDKYP